MLVHSLVKEWHDHYDRNMKRHCYYVMHNRLVDLGISIPPKLRNLDAACGWAQKTVDVMVEHSIFDGYTVGVPLPGEYRRVFSTYDSLPDGGGPDEMGAPVLEATREECDGREYRLTYDLRPYESLIVELP